MTKTKISELEFNEIFFVFDFHFNNKREHYNTKIEINKRKTREMLHNGSLKYTPENDISGVEVYWGWNLCHDEHNKYKKKYIRIYKYIKDISDVFGLFYDKDKKLLLVYDPNRKYKDITFQIQE
jgi:hypothetical protein